MFDWHKQHGPALASRSNAARVAELSYEEMPLSLLLFKYLWPFWMFKDANHGDRFARAAAYRYNRGMRIYLPSYLRRWAVNCALLLAAVFWFDSASQAHHGSLDLLKLIAAAAGVAFACGFCLWIVTMYVYCYLTHVVD